MYDITSTTLGKHLEEDAAYLNRTITWTEGGLLIERDPKHVITLLREWGMEQCRGRATPVCRDEVEISGNRTLSDPEATNYRRDAGRINYMAQDRTLCIP